MSLNWNEFLGNALANELGPLWPPDIEQVKNSALGLVVKWIAGDERTIKKAIEDALSDDKLTEGEVTGILSLVAQGWPDHKFFGSDFVQRLLASLSDGRLTAGELAAVAAGWTASRTKDDALKQLIKSSADGHLSRDEVEDALLKWLKESGPAGVDEKLKTILESPDPVDLRSVITIAVSFLVTDGKITAPITTIEKQIRATVEAFIGYESSELVGLVRALADNDYATAARKAIQKLGVDVSDELVQQVMQGRIPEIAQPFLARALKREIGDVTDEQATGLAKAIIDIVTGKVELIPPKTEQEALAFDDWEYEIWVRVRKVLYAVKMVLLGAPIVAADPQARPHVFAAAAITLDTPVKDLASDQGEHQRLLDLLQSFTYQEFRNRPGGEMYKTERPIYMDMLRDGKTARFIFGDVKGKLRNA